MNITQLLIIIFIEIIWESTQNTQRITLTCRDAYSYDFEG
jgi:hypothetical protein